MGFQRKTPELSPVRGIIYVGVMVVTYLVSLLNLFFLPPRGQWSRAWAESGAQTALTVGYSIRIGLIYAALILLGVWICCGRGSSLIRMLIGIGVAVTGVWWLGAFTIAEFMRMLDRLGAIYLAGVIVFHFLTVVMFAWVLRRLGGWPAPPREDTPSEPSFWQYHLGELFLLVTASGAALATMTRLMNLANHTLMGTPNAHVLELIGLCFFHLVWQVPPLILAAFAAYAAADSERSLTRTLWVFGGLFVIAFVWIGIESSFNSSSNFSYPRYNSPYWISILPGVFSYFFTISFGLLAAREFGWLEVPVDGWEREKPVASRAIVLEQDDTPEK